MKCLSPEQLEALARGNLDDDAAAEGRRHAGSCPQCRAQLAEAQEMEALASELRALPGSRGDAVPAAIEAGLSIPGYCILRTLSHGGQGVVYEAEQISTRRSVALKLLLPRAHGSAAARRRFDRETELAAHLHHPNIVAIFDSGTTPDGRQFYVMDFVRGLPLHAYVRQHVTTVEDVLQLFLKVCGAIQYAHQRGVIHRDLKPSNILVDECGEPKMLDFGLAKQIDHVDHTAVSNPGDLLGTLPYMSPEQVRGLSAEIDTRTDIYALGVILYELLTGRFPYPVHGSALEVAGHILDTEPTPPGRAWAASSGIRSRTRRRLRAGASPIDEEIETIVLKLLSKDARRRYPSAAELVQELERYVAGAPIEAKRDSGWYVLRKNLRRYRLPLATVAAFVLLLAGSAIVSGALYLRASEQRDLAEERAEQLAEVASFQASMLTELDAEETGRALFAALRDEFRTTQADRGLDAAAADERLAALDEMLVGVNLTNVAAEHLDAVLLAQAERAIDGQFPDQALVRGQLLFTLGGVRQELGLYESAERALRESLRLREAELGRAHFDTLVAIQALGSLLVARGEFDEARPLLTEAAQTLRRESGETDRQTMSALTELATLYLSVGDLEAAEQHGREALDLWRSVFGPEDPGTLTTMSNLATILIRRGQHDEAEAMLRACLDRRRALFGADDPATLNVVNTLGGLLEATGRPGDAEGFFREALAGRSRVLGDEHPETLTARSNLAHLFVTLGRLPDAEPHYRAVLESRQRVLGPQHPDTLVSRNNLADLLLRSGRLDEAAEQLEQALRGFRALLPDDHPATLTVCNNLSMVLMQLGDVDRAEPYVRAALEGRRRVLGPDHPSTLKTTNNLGVLLRETGRPEEAEPLVRQALEGRRARFGDDHPETLSSISTMGALLADLGRSAEAEEHLKEALERTRAVRGEDHPATIKALYSLGSFLATQVQPAAAIPLLREAVDRSRRVLGAEHWELGQSLRALGEALADTEHLAEAETALLEAHGILENALGPEHERTRASITSLARLYDAMEQPHTSASWRERLEAGGRLAQPSRDGSRGATGDPP